MVNYKLQNGALSKEQLEELAAARELPVVYDEDSPEMDDAMEKAFAAARKEKPFRGKELTLIVSEATIAKAKDLGKNYPIILGKLLDKAVTENIS